jgi:hypothetical protein
MQLEEFKRELEALMSKVDNELAEAVAATNDPFGQTWQVDAYFPRDKSGKPKKGARVVISISAHFAPVNYQYTGEP